MLTDFETAIVKYLKKYIWLVFMTIMSNFLAFAYWDSFLSTGSIHDGKHGFTFIGENAYGHLAFSTFGAILFSYFFIKSIFKFKSSN